jgi:hypothetical protein
MVREDRAGKPTGDAMVTRPATESAGNISSPSAAYMSMPPMLWPIHTGARSELRARTCSSAVGTSKRTRSSKIQSRFADPRPGSL